MVGSVAAINMGRYFRTYDYSPAALRTLGYEMAEASRYMNKLPDGSYVYLYYDLATLNFEPRQFLAPNVEGEDRSLEFGAPSLTFEADRAKDVVFMFLGRYIGEAPMAQARYPGGTMHRAVDGHGAVLFISYSLPKAGATP